MNSRYGLPKSEIERVRQRDAECVYCHKKMVRPGLDTKRQDWATIEHLNHLPPWNNPRTIAICCCSCNSSRGRRMILEWFKSKYCIKRGINPNTVAQPVFDYIRAYEGYMDK